MPGSTLTIYDNKFASNPSDNIVSVGGSRAYVITASSTKVTVRVPRGITHKPVSVTVNHLSCFSSVSYITTYKTGNAFSPGSLATPQDFYMGARPISIIIQYSRPFLVAIGRVFSKSRCKGSSSYDSVLIFFHSLNQI